MYIPWEELESSMTTKSLLAAELVSVASSRLKDAWNHWTGTYRHQLRRFHPKVRLFIEKESYVIKTVESSWELEAALKLRHEIFFQEMQGKPQAGGYDIDEFDLLCDHLVIYDIKTHRVVGTYRLNSTLYSTSFYSNKEFYMDDFLRLPGHKLELGRACIHKDFRNGLILSLLWKGIVKYAGIVGAQRLFGCSSVQTTDASQALKMTSFLEHHGYTVQDLNLDPRPGFRFVGWDEFRVRYENRDAEMLKRARRSLPPLLLAYLRMGARVAAQPALDRAFQCVDFMTILETEKITDSYERKFSRC